MQVNNHKALGEAIVVWINQIQLKGSLGEPIRSLLDLKDGMGLNYMKGVIFS